VTKLFLLIHIILVSLLGCSYVHQSETNRIQMSNDIILKALKERNDLDFDKKTRDFYTVVEDSSKFDYIFPNTDISCGYIIRYFFHTSIHLSSESNELVSMNGSVFDIEVSDSTNDKDYIINLTQNVLIKIGDMYYGFSELKDFLDAYPNVIISN